MTKEVKHVSIYIYVKYVVKLKNTKKQKQKTNKKKTL